MGFLGKPSKACELCRSRRTRVGLNFLKRRQCAHNLQCDLQRPECGQCRRKNVTCIYRDLTDLAFRNENEAAARKVHQVRPTPDINPFDPPYSRGRSNDSTELVRFLQLSNASGSPQEVALAFFMSSCTWATSFDYVPELYSRSDSSAALKASLEAVGLATLSLARSESSLLDMSRRSHLVAVKEIQQALNSPVITRRADTLAAIMLLALFSGVTFEPSAARINWTKHIRGALAVLNVRSDTNTDDDPILNILRSHVISCVLVDCQQSNTPSPKQFQEIRFEPRMPVSFQEKSEFVLDKLAEVKNIEVSPLTAMQIFDDLDQIDTELDELLEALPVKHPYHLDSENTNPEGPAQHVYLGHRSARIWNIIRITKLNAYSERYTKALVTQTLGEDMCDELNIDTQQQLLYATASAASAIKDICASVPQFLRSPNQPDYEKGVNWAYSLLWPLSLAKASPHLPEDLEDFIQQQLQLLWDVTNLGIVDCHEKTFANNVDPQMW